MRFSQRRFCKRRTNGSSACKFEHVDTSSRGVLRTFALATPAERAICDYEVAELVPEEVSTA
jgi:hypothetical protein